VQPTRRLEKTVRFGPFEVDLRHRLLWNHGVRVRLQAQPFQVLAALLETPGAAVTRDELRRRIWAEDTFVDFEHGVNAAVTRLRQALNDSADNPLYIETLPKLGYRFIGQLEMETAEPTPRIVPEPVLSPKRRAGLWVAATALMLVGIPFLWRARSIPRAEPQAARAVPLTAFRGREGNPALSPDGSRVAFSWNGEKQDNFDIYVMQIGAEAPVRITSDPASDVSPAWSPDGRTMAFVRTLSYDRGEIVLVPAAGGPEHRIGEVRDPEFRETPPSLVSLTWSPDGRWIGASHRGSHDTGENIYLFSVTGEVRRVTGNGGAFGYHTPAFSPDGRALAFGRMSGNLSGEIVVLRLGPDFRPVGKERSLTAGARLSVRPSWTPDGNGILYLSARRVYEAPEIRLVQVWGDPISERPVPVNDHLSEFTAGRDLVYSRRVQDMNIWRAPIATPGHAPSEAEMFLSSTREDRGARYSPEGKRIAFVSSRSGTQEVWVASADGTNAVRLTGFGGTVVGPPAWSPDGQWIAFHARPEGHASLFVIPAAGGTPRRLTNTAADDLVPTFSRDGRWINFSSTRSGQEQIWRMPSTGGEAVQLTTTGACQPFEAADGKFVFYIAKDGSGIRKVPTGGGESLGVVGPIEDYVAALAVTSEGVYFPGPPHSLNQRFIRFFRFSTGENRPVAVSHYPLGLTVSPDSNYVVFDQIDDVGSDLMLVENFRVP
jgi:Tol biopolymer transport system component/DNA-binding winged helix-turn-helix (wHTH) protein